MKVALGFLLVGGVCLSGWAANDGETVPPPASATILSQQDAEALKAERRADREKRRAELRERMEKRRAERDERMKQEVRNLEAKADAAESRAKAEAEAANAEPAPEVTAVADQAERRSGKRPRRAEVSPEMKRCIRDAVRAEVRPLLEELRQLRRELDGRIRRQDQTSARNSKRQNAE